MFNKLFFHTKTFLTFLNNCVSAEYFNNLTQYIEHLMSYMSDTKHILKEPLIVLFQ